MAEVMCGMRPPAPRIEGRAGSAPACPADRGAGRECGVRRAVRDAPACPADRGAGRECGIPHVHPASRIPHPARSSGQAIVEYLVVAAAVVGVILAVAGGAAFKDKLTSLYNNTADKVSAAADAVNSGDWQSIW